MFERRGSRGQTVPVCWGKGFKAGRWKVHLHPVFYLTPKKKGWGVGTDCIWWGASVSALRPFSISPGRRSLVFPVLQGRVDGGLTAPPRKRRGNMGGKGD